jgi:hypothetical protein
MLGTKNRKSTSKGTTAAAEEALEYRLAMIIAACTTRAVRQDASRTGMTLTMSWPDHLLRN